MNGRTVLVWLLRVFGGSAMLAAPAVFLPTSWMAAVHSWVGLDVFPEAPIVEYLARCLSTFYALVGALLVLLASDVERYRDVIRFAGWGSAIAGVAFLGIDIHAGMPFWWTVHEGPMATAFGLTVVWLVNRFVPEADRG